jgi:predicted ribosome-associated RNA-binding protein Tma20
MEQAVAVGAALMGVNELSEQDAHGVIDRKWHRLGRKGHTGAVGGEV